MDLKLYNSINSNLLLTDDLDKKDHLFNSSSYQKFIALNTKFNIHKNKQFNCWIPNNSGLLRWNRIGNHENEEGRISFNQADLIEHGDTFKEIEIIDTDLNIEDHLPTLFSKFKDLKNIYFPENEEFNYNNFNCRRKIYGINPAIKPLFYANVKFTENGNDVKSGEGHLVKDGKYTGKAMLCYLNNSKFSNFKKLKTRKKLEKLYTSLPKNVEDKDYNNIYDELCDFFKEESVAYSLEIDFEVEAKGMALIKDAKLRINPYLQKLTLENILSDEGFKQKMQLIFGQLKRVFHGDHHHHNKDDIILKIYKAGASPIIPLDQIASYIKELDKVEKNRERMLCKEYIPYYNHDAKGIVAYSKMYFNNYIKSYTSNNNLNDQEIISNGERMLSAIESAYNSLESTINRIEEKRKLKEYSRAKTSIFREFPFWIVTFAILTFLVKIGSNDQNFTINSLFLESIANLIKCSLESTVFVVICIIFILYRATKQNLFKYFCKCAVLHSDNRPKDKYHSSFFDRSTSYFLSKEFFLIFIVISLLLVGILL